MSENYFYVDAFVGAGLHGNPAGVYLLKQPLETAQMQAIGNELSLPETSFVWEDGDMHAIRWFTPTREMDLCGHATLTTAHVLLNVVNPALSDIRFRSVSGELYVRRDATDGESLILDSPSRPSKKITEPVQLAALLGAQVQEVWQAQSMMVVLADEAQLKALRPDIPVFLC